ncbi:FHA domain-containing protein [bacterium]|nr:FHA domain-containing protein [bacterium]
MANRATQSLTTGMKILGGANIPTYTLEYLTSTAKHKQGSYETIVVPYIELGRDKKCGVEFGDDTPTVSRRHCAIERKGEETFIVNLSTSNPTLVNGRPVNEKFFLNNGDEIQLSMEGPKLRFNTTKTGTAKMGFTNKMNLVMKQAIKPYKTAAIAFLVALLVLAGGGTFAIIKLNQKNEIVVAELKKQKDLTAAQADSMANINKKNAELVASLAKNKKELENKLAAERSRIQAENARLTKTLSELKSRNDSLMNNNKSYVELIEPLKEYTLAIFYKGIKVEFNGSTIAEETYDPNCMCTGFLLEDGTFVTARHCIDAILTEIDVANFYDASGGSATLSYMAMSYDGNIKIDFTNKMMKADYSMDSFSMVTYQGMSGSLRRPNYFEGADWAYLKTSYNEGLPYDKSLSRQIPSGTELMVLGYSYGMEYRKSGTLEPYFSTAKVTLTGLQNGTINVTEAGWDGGNSGGPLFMEKDGRAICIGLVTGTFRKMERTGSGDVVGMNAGIKIVTPLCNF